MKKRIILLYLFVALVAGALITVGLAVNSPSCWQKLAMKLLNTSHVMRVREVVIHQVSTDFLKGKIVFSGVTIKLKHQETAYFISLAQFSVEGLYELLKNHANLRVDVQHAAVVSDKVNMSDLSLEAKVQYEKRQVQGFDGIFKIDNLDYAKIQISNIHGLLKGNLQKVYLNQVKSLIFDGEDIANITLGFTDGMTITLNETFTKINLARLTDINPDVFKQLKGLADGQLQITLSDGNVKAFRGRIYLGQGGEVNPAVLQYIAPYIPQKSQIDALIKAGQPFVFTKGQIESLSLDDRKYSSKLKIYSVPLNLDINVDMDINLENGLMRFIQQSVWGNLCVLLFLC